jgi:hypothetical protein
MKKSFSVLLILVATLLFCNCSSNPFSRDLSRSKAKSLLEAQPRSLDTTIKKVVQVKYVSLSTGRPIEEVRNQEEKQKLDSLQSNGYISIQQTVSTAGNYYQEYYYNAIPTAKLTPFILDQDDYGIKVKTADVIVDQITGISKISDSDCYAQFTVIIKPTTIGMFFPSDPYSMKRLQSGVIVAYFKRYDDGWRFGGYQSSD